MKPNRLRSQIDSWLHHRPSQSVSGRPRAFLDVHDYIAHIRFVFRMKWWWLWQIPLTTIMFFELERFNRGFIEAFGIYALGFAFAPLVEEGAKAWSLRTYSGRRVFGAGFAISFPIIEMLRSYQILNHMHELTWGLILLRAIGPFLHLYTHFVQAYGLSFFGNRNRTVGSFATAVLIHGGFNAGMSICTWIAYG